MWNKALNLQEIKCIYKSPVDTGAAGLKLYYDFNQGIAGAVNTGLSTLFPKAGNINATLNAFSLFGTNSNWVDGVVNYTPLNITRCAGQTYTYNSQTLSTSGNYSKKYVAANGCDSVEVLTLRIPDTSIAITGATLQVDNVPGATYKWKNCATHAAIAGATNYYYTPTTNGGYYVVIDLPGAPACHDSSACYSLLNVGLTNNSQYSETKVFPNPFDKSLSINFGSVQKWVSFSITDITGQELLKSDFENFLINVSK